MHPAPLRREVWTVDADAFPADGSIEDQARFLLRYAILAPSSHNSQPWEFRIERDSIEIRAAEDRRLPVADEDKRELFLSLGCAIENLAIASAHFEFGYRIEYPEDTPVAVVTLEPAGSTSRAAPPGLFEQLTERYTNHQPFEERPLPEGLGDRLPASVVESDVELRLIDDPDQIASIAELQAEADRKLMANPDYRRELGHWIGTGVLGQSWVAARIGKLVVSHLDLGDREAQKNATLLESAPVIGVLVTETDEPHSLIGAGRAFERLALLATAEGVAVHPMSQILERAETTRALATLLDTEPAQPRHLFRLGYAADTQRHTPRWPPEAVIVE